MGTTQELAKFIVKTRFEDFPGEVIDYSKKLILSCLGAMIAGSTLPAGKILIKYTKEAGGTPEAGVAGAGFRTSAPDAALAHGTFGHATELEDDSFPEGTFTYNVIPAALAMGEKLKLSGKKVLEGFIIGYEIESRIGRACQTAQTRGFLQAGLQGTVGSAATAAKMLGLDVDQTRMGLSIGASHASGLLRQIGSMAHFLECGIGAKNGVVAGLLAKHGLTGNPDIIEVSSGYCDAIAGRGEYNLEAITKDLGKTFRVMEVGIKKYPCCYLEQRIIDGVLDLIKEQNIAYKDVESVEVEVNSLFAEIVPFPDPSSGEIARFSMEHSIAIALLERRVFLEAFTDEKAVEPKLKEARKKVKVIVHPEWARLLIGEEGNPLTIKLKNGRVLTKLCKTVRGDPPLYLTTDQVMDKYKECAHLVLSSAQLEQAARMVLGLENVNDITELMEIATFAK